MCGVVSLVSSSVLLGLFHEGVSFRVLVGFGHSPSYDGCTKPRRCLSIRDSPDRARATLGSNQREWRGRESNPLRSDRFRPATARPWTILSRGADPCPHPCVERESNPLVKPRAIRPRSGWHPKAPILPHWTHGLVYRSSTSPAIRGQGHPVPFTLPTERPTSVPHVWGMLEGIPQVRDQTHPS